MKKCAVVLVCSLLCVSLFFDLLPSCTAVGLPQGEALSVAATPDGARLRCLYQRLEAHATLQGLELVSTVDSRASAPFRVRAVSAGRQMNCAVLAPAGGVTVQNSLAVWQRPGLIEEYSVSMDGIRQDFVIAERPVGSGDICVDLAVDGATAQPTADGVQLTLEGSHRKLAYDRFKIIDAQNRELTARIEVASNSRIRITISEADATYPVRIDPTFSDANWISLSGYTGLSDRPNSIAINTNAGIVYVSGQFKYAGNQLVNHIAAWNGTTWLPLGTGMTNGTALALAVDAAGNLYAGGTFSAVGGIVASNMAVWNGSSWSALGLGIARRANPLFNPAQINALAFDGRGNLYVAGSFDTAGGVAATNVAVWDGSAWSALGLGLYGAGSPPPFSSWSVGCLVADAAGNLYAGGQFNRAGNLSATNIAKWDGNAWTNLGLGLGNSNGLVISLEMSGTNLYAGGNFTNAGGIATANFAVWDGSAWSTLGTGIGGVNDSVNSVVHSGTNLFVGGRFSSVGAVQQPSVAFWHNGTWSVVGSGLVGGNGTWVYKLVPDGAGGLFAIGNFTNIAVTASSTKLPLRYAAQWHGDDWSGLGSGIVGAVNALALDGSGNIFVGGSFTNAQSGVSTPNVNLAEWNGTSWSGVGSGVNGAINALAVSGTNLYVGGSFTKAGTANVVNVASWNGSSWSAMTGGINGPVYALAVDSSGNLYAAGAFNNAGGVLATNVASWNGSAWSAMASGLSCDPAAAGLISNVFCLAVSGNNVYAGGQFTRAGNVLLNNVAQWNGSTWSTLGSGITLIINVSVRALAVDATGNLYAGGQFDTAGGVGAVNIAQWNGTAWSALGSGITGNTVSVNPVSALVVSGTNLYASGNFTNAGGVTVANVAQWDGSAWSALGSGITGLLDNHVTPPPAYPTVKTLAADALGNVYFGGVFTNAGVGPAVNLAMLRVDTTAPAITVQQPPGNSLVYGVATAAFDNLLYGTTAINWFIVTNTGTATLIISNLTFAGANSADFTLEGAALPISVGVAGNATFGVVFAPSSSGPRSARLQIANNDPTKNPFVIALAGTGIAPIAITVPSTITAEATSSNGAVVNFSVSATDTNDGPLTPIAVPASGSNFPLGTNLVTVFATDSAGWSATNIFQIVVHDTTPPVIVANTNAIVLAMAGACYATNISLSPPLASDACGVANIVSNLPASLPVGTNSVVWTAIDTSGNTATSAQLVIVADTQPPAIVTCAADISALTNTPFGTATNLALGSATATDNCAVSSITNNAPAQFPLGTNLVTWTAVDASGNTSTCQQRVVVLAFTPQNQFTFTNINGAITITKYNGTGGPVAIPNLINGLPVTIIGIGAFSGSRISSVSVPDTVTNIGPGAFDSCSSLINAVVGSNVISVGNNAFDYCSGLTWVVFYGNAPSVGSNVYSGSGKATNYFQPCTSGWGATLAGRPAVLQGAPTPNPTLVTNADVSLLCSLGLCSATNVSLTPPAASGQCAILSLSNNLAGTDNLAFAAGTNVVIWTATDASGNTATSQQLIIVNDTQAPMIGTNADTVVSTATNLVLTPPAVSDNCGVAGVTNNAPSSFPVGTNIVIWTAADTSGNTATSQQLVIVNQSVVSPPSLTGAWTNGVFDLTVDGPAGPDYILQLSLDLTNWADVATNLSPVPPFHFTDPNGTNSAAYYRVRLGP